MIKYSYKQINYEKEVEIIMITIFGLGFVGITTALYFAEKTNYDIYGIDISAEKQKLISKGTLPFNDFALEKLLKKHINNNFFISNDIKKAINNSQYLFITVGTPIKKSGQVELCDLKKVLDTILKNIDTSTFKTIVIKSSIPPTTTNKFVVPYIEKSGLKIGKDIGLCVNPEFLREGQCVTEIENPNHIVIGCNDDKSMEMMKDLYENQPCFYVDYVTAEFSKYLSNSFLTTLISFSNEMSIMAECLGNINIKQAFSILKSDNRWGNCEMRSYVHPIGKYGGYCLPKDVKSLYYISKKNNFDSKILKSTIQINNNLENYFYNKIVKHIDLDKKIGILGLSFKPNSDDVRDTSSYYVIKKLLDNNYHNILAYDPISIDNFKKNYTTLDIEYIDDYHEILNKADVLVILTIWDEFQNIKNICDKPIIDFTNNI